MENYVKTVFACSGAADVGQLSDVVARELHKKGACTMKCLAFIGGGITKMIDSIKDTKMLVIDGCEIDCGRLTMEKNDLRNFTHFRLTDIGFKKGTTVISNESINYASKKAIELMN